MNPGAIDKDVSMKSSSLNGHSSEASLPHELELIPGASLSMSGSFASCCSMVSNYIPPTGAMDLEMALWCGYYKMSSRIVCFTQILSCVLQGGIAF